MFEFLWLPKTRLYRDPRKKEISSGEKGDERY